MTKGSIIMLTSSLKLKLAACAVAIASVGSASATPPALSWNLSRDLYLSASGVTPNTNPVGAWSLMYGNAPQLLSTAFQTCPFGGPGFFNCWDSTPVSDLRVWINSVTQVIQGTT